MKGNRFIFLLLLLPCTVQAYTLEHVVEQAEKINEKLDRLTDMGEQLIKKFDEEVLPMLDKRQEELDRKHQEWRKEHERRNQD